MIEVSSGGWTDGSVIPEEHFSSVQHWLSDMADEIDRRFCNYLADLGVELDPQVVVSVSLTINTYLPEEMTGDEEEAGPEGAEAGGPVRADGGGDAGD